MESKTLETKHNISEISTKCEGYIVLYLIYNALVYLDDSLQYYKHPGTLLCLTLSQPMPSLTILFHDNRVRLYVHSTITEEICSKWRPPR